MHMKLLLPRRISAVLVALLGPTKGLDAGCSTPLG
jgi:hypothetical protein